jgi:hypothetical protein
VNLFSTDDPFDHPLWRNNKPIRRIKLIGDDSFIGCPVRWLQQVSSVVQSKDQLIVALLLYRHHALYRGKTFAFSNTEIANFGISHQTKYRALGYLEAAGLIRVEKVNGRASLVALTCPGSAPLHVYRYISKKDKR